MKKHIVCLGDSNTHGYCADPLDTEDGGIRFTENERWTCLLQKGLGDDYLVTEEGLSGRTTVFKDPVHESMDAFSVAYPILKSHEVIDLLIIMLGTNDTKDRFNANANIIDLGMQRLVKKCQSVDCWGDKKPNILIIAPPHIKDGFCDPCMGEGCILKSSQIGDLFNKSSKLLGCHFMDAEGCEFNHIDYMHLSKKGHRELADRLIKLVPQIV